MADRIESGILEKLRERIGQEDAGEEFSMSQNYCG